MADDIKELPLYELIARGYVIEVLPGSYALTDEGKAYQERLLAGIEDPEAVWTPPAVQDAE